MRQLIHRRRDATFPGGRRSDSKETLQPGKPYNRQNERAPPRWLGYRTLSRIDLREIHRGFRIVGVVKPARSLDPESLLSAYAQGVFPMTDPDGVTRWYTADPRGVIPLDRFHIPRTLRQVIRQGRFEIRVNQAFRAVMTACMTVVRRRDREALDDDGMDAVNHAPGEMTLRELAQFLRAVESMPAPPRSWISPELIDAYCRLHEQGFAHSVEAWQRGRLVGGLYGVSLGGAFFGESMFHHVRDASKVALAALVDRLRERGYVLLDAQANTHHLRRFGCVDVPAKQYLIMLRKALVKSCRFD